MTIFEFVNSYPDETSCEEYLRKLREKEGINCPNCVKTEHRWMQGKKAWECKKCRSRKSLKSGTIMENTNLPLLLWFRAIALVSMTKKSISSKELQRQLGLKRYQPAWEMAHKIRSAMGQRDEDYLLCEQLEVDEGFFTTCEHLKSFEKEKKKDPEKQESNQDSKGKRGRGSENKSTVLVMVESIPQENPKKGKRKNRIDKIKMKVIKGQDSHTIERILTNSVLTESLLHTDGYPGYSKVSDNFEHSISVIKDKALLEEHFPWVHAMISNAKRLFLGIHHKVGKGYLHLYLNEFCYKFNRRYMRDKMVDRLLVACVNSKPSPLYTMRSCG